MKTQKSARKGAFLQWACKPGSVIGSHLSGTDIAARLGATCLEIGRAGRSPQVGVASDRVYRMPRSPGTPVGSYPTFPPFPRRGGVVSFCCTCPAVARGRCYRLSCSVKPGLSSRGEKNAPRGCPARCHFIISGGEKKVNRERRRLSKRSIGFLKKDFINMGQKRVSFLPKM